MDRFSRWRQISPLLRTLEDMRSEFENVLTSGATPAGHWTPMVDVYELSDALVIQVELPGIKQEDIHLHIEGNELTLSGDRRYIEPEGGQVHRIERMYGTFQRSFQLPVSVQRDAIKATLKEGVLVLRLPKAQAAKPQQIHVTVED